MIVAKGLARPDGETEKLSYSAANEEGDVEVRNQRGQIEKGATGKAQRVARGATSGATKANAARQTRPVAAPQKKKPVQRGAFGQTASDDDAKPAPANRAQRRSQQKKK